MGEVGFLADWPLKFYRPGNTKSPIPPSRSVYCMPHSYTLGIYYSAGLKNGNPFCLLAIWWDKTTKNSGRSELMVRNVLILRETPTVRAHCGRRCITSGGVCRPALKNPCSIQLCTKKIFVRPMRHSYWGSWCFYQHQMGFRRYCTLSLVARHLPHEKGYAAGDNSFRSPVYTTFQSIVTRDRCSV